MLNEQQRIDMASAMLTQAKMLVPNRVPNAVPGMAEEWAATIGSRFEMYPPGVWKEAVRVWALEYAPDGTMLSPGVLLRAARVVRDRWESHQERRNELNAWRDRRTERREALIAAGRYRGNGIAPARKTDTPQIPRGRDNAGGEDKTPTGDILSRLSSPQRVERGGEPKGFGAFVIPNEN